MDALPLRVLYYGRDEPLAERRPLRAGPLTLLFEDGDLRYVMLGDREVLRRAYVSVRDNNWDTVPPVISNLQTDEGADWFRISFDAEHRERELDFAWKGTVTGDARGTVTFAMDGQARSTFRRNRIGFCVLHPMQCAGARCVIEKVCGSTERAAFPRHISPHQPFKGIRAISHEVLPGAWAEVRFAGEVFEMEDQRNWTDASFKTYCTPLTLPFPVTVQAGTEISQSVTLALNGDLPAPSAGQDAGELRFAVTGRGAASAVRVPRVGLGVASHGKALAAKEIERLRALNLSHLRVDLDLTSDGYEPDLRRAADEARALGVSLEMALTLSDDAAGELEAFRRVLEQVRPPVSTWLIFHAGEECTPERSVKAAREWLAGYEPRARFGAGAAAYFTELNRGRPDPAALDAVCYSLNPQVHAFDNASLVETLEGQAATVESARRFAGDLPVVVSPVTLMPRFNPNATGPEAQPPPGELPAQVDVRQMSLFGAAWTAGSLKALFESGVDSVTYYETAGWLGVMETESGSPSPTRFRSLPGCVFPMYHTFADVGEFAGGEVVPTRSSDTLEVDGLAVFRDGRTRVLLANMTDAPRQVVVEHLSDSVHVRSLDETNTLEAMCAPEAFRERNGDVRETRRGELRLELLPYATVRIDGA